MGDRRIAHRRRGPIRCGSASRCGLVTEALTPGGDVLTLRLHPCEAAGVMSTNEAAIVGVGMHPFGRTDGVSGRSRARRGPAALADAGIGWSDVQFAFGGSDAAGQRRRAGRRPRAHRHRVRQRVQRLRNRRQSRWRWPTAPSAPAPTTSASRSASTSTRRAPSTRCPPQYGLGDWYGETGMMLTTQFFAMKVQRYLLRARSRPGRARGDRRQGVSQRRAEPQRVAAHADVDGGDRRVADGQRLH